MKVRLRNIVEDQDVQKHKEIKPVEGWTFEGESFFLDGPVCRRVAVLDFDGKSGQLLPGVAFRAPEGISPGGYPTDETNLTTRPFIQASVFSTVLKTMDLFEESDALGRQIEWAFGAPQLLVVPVAGERANAFYERASHSLQFFYFRPGAETIYTALSQDIVSHETAHALLDGIAPDLYNALTPQSLALHETIADLAAVIMSFRSRELTPALLKNSGGSIAGDSAFTWLAQEFGRARDGSGRTAYLRNLWNQKNLNSADQSFDEAGEPNFVDPRSGPHQLSQVLGGALYRVAYELHEEYKSQRQAEMGVSAFSASGWALFVATEHFKRLILRALDYLPPGEVSFTDYGRAILAADQASHPEDSLGRDRLRREFLDRHICSEAELEVRTNFDEPAVAALDLHRLVESDWAAYAFANQNRAFLGIPPDGPFRVRPRLESKKDYYLRGGKTPVRECIFKVSWDVEEPNPAGLQLPQRRQVTAGTTLVIDWETRKVRALLTSNLVATSGGRDEMLQRLADGGHLQFTGNRTALDRGVRVESSGDLMRVRGSARLLHIVE